MRRKTPPGLPEISQPQALRHWLRLSQMTLGMEMEIDLGVGTCTMKYSPKVNEELAGMVACIHPDQPEETIQGLLEVAWRFGNVYLREISGMDAFTFQPPGGSAGAFNNAVMMRKYHEEQWRARAARRGHHDHLQPPVRRRVPCDGGLQGGYPLPRR